MIDYQTFCQLRQLYDEKGLKISQIAAELQLDLKTVEKWVDQPTYHPRQGTRRTSKLDSFKGQIAALLERHPYTAQQLFRQLRQQGYAGGYTILKKFVRQVRPPRKPAFLMLEFAPGECAQVDWGNFGSVAVGSTRRRLSFFVMVLCYSRLMYVEFTLSEGMEQFLSCHRHAFEFFQGSPKRSKHRQPESRGAPPSLRREGSVSSTLPGPGGSLRLPTRRLQCAKGKRKRARGKRGRPVRKAWCSNG